MVDTVKHTPGPWLNAGRGAGSHIHADKGEVAWLRSYMGIPDEEIDANALLIAAAPDLLEALHLVGMSAGWQYLTMETRAVIEAAIAKAEGRS